jgi:hypothetical protein
MKPMMLIKSAALAGAAILLPLAAAPVHAQGYPPGGSYLQTCTDVRAFGDRIVADCQRMDGGWDRTVLRDIGSCAGDIANMNGQLACSRGPSEGYGSSYGPYPPYGYGWGR